MATLPINLEVEDVAVGPVLIALRKMPGIIKLHLGLDQIAGPPAHKHERGRLQELVLARLLKENGKGVSLKQLAADLGIETGSAHNGVNRLRQRGVAHSLARGVWAVTPKALRAMTQGSAIEMPANGGAVALLPKPREAAAASGHGGHSIKHMGKRHKGKRAPRGLGEKLLLSKLSTHGATKREELIKLLDGEGVRRNSIAGILDRASRDKLAKSDGAGVWQLTEKGSRQHASQQQQQAS